MRTVSPDARAMSRIPTYCRAPWPLAWALFVGVCAMVWGGCSPSASDATDATSQSTTQVAPASKWVHVRLQGELDVGAQALLERAIRTAKSEDARTLVVEIDTPGGALDVLWVLQRQLYEAESSGIETVAWINRHATSAGALVSLACKRIYMHSGGTIGSALPVVVGAEGLMPIPDATVREKEISFLRSQFAAAAEKHGRNPALAAAMVDPDAEARLIKVDGEARVVGAGEYDALRQEGREFSLLDTLAVKGKLVNLTARRAVELRMADALADDAPALMERAGLNATTVVGPLEKSRSESFVAWIERLTPILLMAGLVLGFLELKSPGFGVPGVLAIAAFVVLLVGKYFAGLAEVPHLVAVGAGVVLLIIELFVMPGVLWFGALGLLLIFGGLVLSGAGTDLALHEPFAREALLRSTLQLLAAASGALVLSFVLSRYLPKTPVLRKAVLTHAQSAELGEGVGMSTIAVGTRAVALTDLRPVGKIRCLNQAAGVEHEARSEGPLVRAGATVVVVQADMGRLLVREVST